MHYKRIFMIVASSMLALVLVSCDQLFESNLFRQANIGQVNSSSLASMNAEDLIAASGILTSQPSDSFFEAFAEAPLATRNAVVQKIQDYYNFPADDPLWTSFDSSSKTVKADIVQTPEQKEAGLVFLAFADLNTKLKVGSDETLLSVVNDASGALLGKAVASLGVADLIPAFLTLPSYLRTDRVVFDSMLDRFAHLDSVYDRLATECVHINSDDYLTISQASTKRDIAQTAAIASVLVMYDPAAGTYSDGSGHSVTIVDGDVKKALFSAVANPDLIDGHPENYPMLYRTPGDFRGLVEDEGSTGPLSYLLKAAHINFDTFEF